MNIMFAHILRYLNKASCRKWPNIRKDNSWKFITSIAPRICARVCEYCSRILNKKYAYKPIVITAPQPCV